MRRKLSSQLYNSRVLKTYVGFVLNRYPHVDIRSILDQCGIEEYEISDQGHWHTASQVSRFYELIVRATGNANLAREAGRYAAAPGVLGMIRQYALGLVGPANTFSLIGKIAKRLTRSSIFRSRKIGFNKVEVCVEPLPGIREKPFVCENRQGYFEAIVMVFNLPIPKIEHPECLFKGGERCRYIISWEASPAGVLGGVRNWSIPLALVGGGLVAARASELLPHYAIGASLFFFGICLAVELARNRELTSSLQNLWSTSEELADQIAINYRNAQLTRAVGGVISSKNTIDDVVQSVIHLLQEEMDFDRGMILLANEDRTRLWIRGAYGYVDQHLDILTDISFRLDKVDGHGIFVDAFREQKPCLVNNVNEIMADLSPSSLEFVRVMGIQSFICVPIVCEGESIGILAVDNLKTKKPLLISDMNMISGVAPVIGVSIHNARLAEAQRRQFEATLRIMADSIDARDFLTAGHSEKVADFAEGIARELGLGDEFIEVIRISALLHDYGKLAVPDTVLKKTVALSAEERAIIRTHPTRTREILEQVPFEGAFAQIPTIAAAHHEHWDGCGYPLGLRGEEIPFGARIIAAADFFEAITALRHYRAPMPIDEALKLLLRESGKRFEPQIVDALVKYIKKVRYSLMAQDDFGYGKERFNPRLPYRTQTSVEMNQRIISGASVNLSAKGIFIRTTEITELQPGDAILITFAIPAPEELVTLPATVAWLNLGTESGSDKLPTGFGACFGDGNPAVAHRISCFISRAYTNKTSQVIIPGDDPLEQVMMN